MAVGSKLDDIKAWYERMSERERRMVGGLSAAIVLLVIFFVGYLVSSGLDEISESNAQLRKALRQLERNKGRYLKHRQRMAALDVRMAHAPLELNTYVEKKARAVGVTIAESGELTPVPGDRFTRRGLEIKVNKISIGQLSALLKSIEDEQAHIVQVTRLSVYTRWNRNQELDVELVVSTYDRVKGKPAPKTRKRRGRRG
ncbi:MAG: type II secretion system protein M [Myxococcales bacterium]|nr:type II secretion system protein M [Myxococcales bacterium]